MKTRKITLLLALMCVIQLVLAADNTGTLEADALYKSANDYYKSGLYQNALKSAHRSKDIYSQAGDSMGVQKSSNLIANIESVLTTKQLAKDYLSIAGDYYLQTESDVEILQRAISMAQAAKKLYQEIGGSEATSGILQCEDIISGSTKKLADELNKCIRDADELYKKSQESFFIEQYVSAREFSLQANKKYVSCPYQPGIDKSAEIITSINSKINTINSMAKAAYDQSIKYYTNGEYELCIGRATESQALYNSIGNSEGAISVTSLISRCKDQQENWADSLIREAEQYRREAEYFSIIPDCLNATDRANKANSIYEVLISKALETERDLNPHARTKTLFYQGLLSEVNTLLHKITTTCSEKRMNEIAEDYYRQSQEYYLDNNLNEALAYATNAKNIFTELKNYVGLSKADTLLLQINQRINLINEAKAYLANARSFYQVANFEPAVTEASKAKNMYSSIREENMTSEAQKLLDDIKAGMTKLEQANAYFEKAQEQFELGQYNNALPPADAAKRIYSEINYSLGVAESERIINISNDEVNAQMMDTLKIGAVIGVILITVAFMILQTRKKKQVLENEFGKMRTDVEEKTRRTREEWEIRSQQETKVRVDDELKRLIDDERDKLESE